MPVATREDLTHAVRSEFRFVPLRELLHKDVTVLLGVDADAAASLKKLEINTLFDLATSAVFDAATKLVNAGSNLRSSLFQHGTPTADMVKEATAAGKKIEDLQFLPISLLEQIPNADAAAIEKALDARSVRDLAFYPPYLTARRFLDAVYFPENVPEFDPEWPADLLPKTGEFPTERVQYSTLLMDEIKTGDGDAYVDIDGEAFAAIDLKKLAQGDAGFKRVAYGALLTFNQSWYAHGVTLGQLLHSAALAPGESTRVAVIDWSRKSRAGQSEVIDEVDDLTNDMSHNRSISEVTKAVANEAQGGFSSANTNSTTTQKGSAEAGEISGGLLGSLLGGPSYSAGGSSSTSTTTSHADGYSSSWGQREVSSDMMQKINDRTHQHAHTSRSRRASVVKEVSQIEHENISTRVIANYNHMHALTVQYYEVVQIYQVEVQLVKAEKVVFIPIALVDFNDETLIRRFQNALLGTALSGDIRAAIRNLDVIEIQPEPKTNFSGIGVTLDKFWKEVVYVKSPSIKAMMAEAQPAIAAAPEEKVAQAAAEPVTLAGVKQAVTEALTAASPGVAATPLQLNTAISAVAQVNDHLWSAEQTSLLSGMLNLMVLRPDSNAIYLPTDVWVEGAVVAAGGLSLSVVFHTQAGGTVTNVSATNPVALSQVSRIGVTGTNSGGEVSATATLTLNRNGVRFPLELPAVTIGKGFSGETKVVKLNPGGVNTNLKQHLMTNRLYYSQAVYRSLDAAQIALLLSGFRVESGGQMVPVAQVVDPKPVRYVGNYLAFIMSVDPQDQTWKDWLRKRGIQVGSADVEVVPLASGGTFAEAVLGRANSAEKLDITRFWNWQDSPIPLQPTEIAAIQAGSRATPEDVKPGQLSAPIINLMTPTTLPDPAGTAAVLAAIQNGNMFRDMSGLQGTIGLAQAALQATAAGAATAGQQAGTNMQNHLQAQTERMRIAADLAKSALAAYTGVPMGGGSSGGGSHSQDGAKVNYFDKTAGQAPGGTASGAGGGAGAAVGTAGGSSGGGAAIGGGSNGTVTSLNGSNGYSHNPGILSATWGDSQPPSGMIDRLVNKITGEEATPSSVADGTSTKAWPKLDKERTAARIQALALNANLFNQGSIGLCTAAAFFHHAIQKEPAKFLSFANALHTGGIGFLGNLKVAPGYDARNADYSALAAKFPPFPPEADWMLMTALRDSENWFFDFEGAPDESTAIRTSAKELSGWYKDTGFYSSIDFDDTVSIPKIKAIVKNANNHVALWIRAKLLNPSSTATHMITVESPITIDNATNKIKFDYWTWGQPVKTMDTTLDVVLESYLGVITAKF